MGLAAATLGSAPFSDISATELEGTSHAQHRRAQHHRRGTGTIRKLRDPRLKQILASLVTHLHAFVRETRLTEKEWAQGIAFLTDTGHMCDDKHQEFILLSDKLGVSMFTMGLNQARPICRAPR